MSSNQVGDDVQDREVDEQVSGEVVEQAEDSGVENPVEDNGDGGEGGSGNRDAAKYRVRAREAEKQVEQLTAQLNGMRDAEFVRVLSGLHRGVKGETLAALGMSRAEFTGKDGALDMQAIKARSAEVVKAHGLGPGLIPGAPPATGDKYGPARVGSATSWSDVLGCGGR